MPKKRIMHKFRMTEISSVDSPAQAGAKMVIMKRDEDVEATAKRMFDEALQDLQLSKEVYELIDKQWELNDALQTSIYSIVKDKEAYPDPVSAVKESLTQYASAVNNLVEEAKEDMDDETMKREIGKRAWQMVSPEDRDESTQKSEEGNMPTPKKGESNVTVESLTESLEKANAELQIQKAYGELTDAEKAHYQTLDEEAQGDFLGMTKDQRASELAKSDETNPVVYTALDGSEFRKSDDPRLIAMAKRNDKNEKENAELRKQNEKIAIEKRVDDEIPNIPGNKEHKVALFKAVEGIEDEDTRKGIYAMFKAHNELVTLSLDTHGEKDSEILKAEDELDKKVKEYQKEHKIDTYEKAYSQFLDTPEGQALYVKAAEPTTA